MELRIQISLILMLAAQWVLLLAGSYFKSIKWEISSKICYGTAVIIGTLMLFGIVFNGL